MKDWEKTTTANHHQAQPGGDSLRRELIRVYGGLRELLGAWGADYAGESEIKRRDQVATATDALEHLLVGPRP